MEYAACHRGKVIERNEDVGAVPTEEPLYAGAKLSEDEEGYGYCTQFILRLGKPGVDGKKAFLEKNFKGFLAKHGKSLVTVRDEDIIKVHVHTLTPGNMLNYAQQFGEFVSITIENMSEEHNNIQHGAEATDMAGNIARSREQKKVEEEDEIRVDKDLGLISVSSGEGLDEIFRELGVDVIVSGGQTMNPSTEDFVRAIKQTHASNVFILPNNSNIVLAASQACEIMQGSGINAVVIPSKTIPQGIVSEMNFNPEGEVPSIQEDMKGALKTVKSGSVTYAIKDTDIDGVHITKDYYMAMQDKNIVSCVKDKMTALTDLVDSLVDDDASMVTVIIGKDVTSEEESKVADVLSEKYGDDLEIDVKRGDQPVYSFLVGIE